MKICVYCGSHAGKDPSYIEMGKAVGALISKLKINLVYGGADVGVMGAVANEALKGNIEVHGIMPKKLMAREVEHHGLTSFEIVEDMHTRKKKMFEYSDCFLALPGGMGTLDEFCEIYTWAQIEYHHKPIILFNVNGFYDMFLAHIKNCINQGFIEESHFGLIKVVDNIDDLETALRAITID